MYEKAGVNVEFVGHPLLSELPPKADRDSFFNDYGFNKEKKLVSIFPGSRVFEIKNLLRLFLDSARILKEKDNNIQFALAQAPSIKDELILPVIKEYDDLNIKVMKNKNYELLSISDALILASGTVALEASLYETPMIISYKGPWFLYFIYLLVRCIKRVSLPNIILNKDVVPEILQIKAKSDIIANNIYKILYDEEYKSNMKNSLKNVKQKLMSSSASLEAANIISKDI